MAKIIPASQPGAIEAALEILRMGGMVAFPTDTVYGLGTLSTNPQAIDQLYVVKGRDAAKAIGVLLGRIDDLALVSRELSPAAQRLVERFWPGPLTLVVPRHPSLPENLSPLPTIGVRIPDHPVAIELLTRAGPLAVTSANLSGQPSTVTADEIQTQLGGYIPLILDGGSAPGGQSSTVVDCTGPVLKILRQGPISAKDIGIG